MAEHKNQAALDSLEAEYMKALYARPRDEGACLAMAEKMLELVRGTRLEQAQEIRVETHRRRVRRGQGEKENVFDRVLGKKDEDPIA